MSDPTILGFDTSGAWVGAAVYRAGTVSAAVYADMTRGQAERLMPMIDDALADAGVRFSELDAIGVGVGPGNFTGIRISVAAARGLALSLGVPAIGVTLFDALALDGPHPALACLNAPREQVYLQRFGDGLARGPDLVGMDGLAEWAAPGLTVIGQHSADLAARLGLGHVQAAHAPASAIAQIAALRLGTEQPRPAPLYLRAAEAAPPRDPPPRILDAPWPAT